ncbi:hypothetical protein [Celeribacter baekdonensis]|uniref:hypothetical protein n=1 Tax=Celeribacter baekdonensis TaxID=875171 RepID=UPI0030DB2D59|tara:strand:- start:25648 stop:25914 length:267 start_codon:yes stop_codon:yes gene_type:complete
MTDLGVSDHAVLRYLERAGGFEIERLRAEIARKVAQARLPDQTYVPIGDLHFIVREGEEGLVVTTVLQRPERKKRKKPKAWRIEDDLI